MHSFTDQLVLLVFVFTKSVRWDEVSAERGRIEVSGVLVAVALLAWTVLEIQLVAFDDYLLHHVLEVLPGRLLQVRLLGTEAAKLHVCLLLLTDGSFYLVSIDQWAQVFNCGETLFVVHDG